MEDDRDEVNDTRGNEAGNKDEATYVPMLTNRYRKRLLCQEY